MVSDNRLYVAYALASGASGVNAGQIDSLGGGDAPDLQAQLTAGSLEILAELPIARMWAGLIPFSLDGRPLIGRVPGRDVLWNVSGLASSGFGRGPMAGKLLADYVHTGVPAPVLAEADPSGRICERRAVHSSGVPRV